MASTVAPRQRHALSWLTDAGYLNMPAWYPYHFITTQLRALPQPSTRHDGQTVLVTGGSAGGLGRAAARHFARLGAARVIVACRGREQEEEQDDECEVWHVDLCSFESVRALCRRADAQLDRLDVVVASAGVAIGHYVAADGGLESGVAVNVVSVFLMVLLLLPAMRRTAARYNVVPRVVVVSSDAHMFAKFAERDAPRIFERFRGAQHMNEDRYNTTKLLGVWVVRELARRMPPPRDDGGDPVVVVTAVNPGLCSTRLFRHAPFPLSVLLALGLRLLGRSPEMGARTLVAAAAAADARSCHGGYMDGCVLREPSELVRSDEGRVLQARVYAELMEVLEGIHPGISKNVAP